MWCRQVRWALGHGLIWHAHPRWLHAVLTHPWCPRPLPDLVWVWRMRVAHMLLRGTAGYTIRRCPRCQR